MNESAATKIWACLQGTAAGRWLFSRLVCWRAPYFASISPTFEELVPDRAVVSMRRWRRVTNHIGTIHAIAMANLCEIAAGTLAEITTPSRMRWIPKGMTIQYLAKASGRIRATASMRTPASGEVQDVVGGVDVHDQDHARVVHADITMYLSPQPDINTPSSSV